MGLGDGEDVRCEGKNTDAAFDAAVCCSMWAADMDIDIMSSSCSM